MEGERVVTNGNFKIDSAMQIQAKPSLMTRPEQTGEGTQQTHCPVMGGKIDKEIFIEYEGKKVYFCCPGCSDEFLKDPQKYMDKLPQFQDRPETPATSQGHVH